ncbi:MAG: putative Glycosyl transferase, group 1 [Solirubrobacterales bacterium]|nr:putative Glycosyl transferase, group 1 [Solirubrobacterales bacterium]
MRICLVTQEYPPGYIGGIGSQSRVKALALAAQGHDVEVLTAGAQDGPALLTREDGPVSVHEARSPGGEFAVYQTETYWLGYTWTVLGALRTLSASRPFDVVDFAEYGAEGFAFQLDRAEDDPTATVVHLHGSLGIFAEQFGWPEPSGRLHQVGTFMEDLSIRAADGLLAASRSVAELTAQRLRLPEQGIAVVGGAVDPVAFSPVPERRATEELRLLFVGSVAENKGVTIVLDAFFGLAPQYPKLSLTIAGGAEEDAMQPLRERIAERGLQERVDLLGFVEHAELADVYREADVLAAPSLYEGGLGMVYLEAMACGLPVVALAAGGAIETVAADQSGILLERGDVEETAAAIAMLLEDPELRLRMGAAGRTRVLERFTPERYAANVADTYERAVERRLAGVVVW